MSTEPTPHFAICIKNEGCDDLELRKLYQILPEEAFEESGLLRVVDESGEDYLYPAANFIRLPLPAAVEQALADLPVGGARVTDVLKVLREGFLD